MLLESLKSGNNQHLLSIMVHGLVLTIFSVTGFNTSIHGGRLSARSLKRNSLLDTYFDVGKLLCGTRMGQLCGCMMVEVHHGRWATNTTGLQMGKAKVLQLCTAGRSFPMLHIRPM